MTSALFLALTLTVQSQPADGVVVVAEASDRGARRVR
jgi:hypothetical protein